jgi:transcriptional regulator with GAF, ATPase, and Fis domain
LRVLQAWVQCHGLDASAQSRICDSISGSGILLIPFDENSSQSNGILTFNQVDDQLFAILHRFRQRRGRVIAVAAAATSLLESGAAWQLLHAGASDVLVWRGARTANQIQAKLNRWGEIEELAAAAIQREKLIGRSPAWLSLLGRVVEAASFSRAPILVTGESGTGKELLARLVHSAGSENGNSQSRRVIVTLDCSTIVPELSGSELFGHERGAFTGAHSLREGAFALADGATLFLDEIGELPLPLQAQLLRAIQEKTYKRVGGNVWLKTDFRLVCATNRDLTDLVRRGLFRLDLYHRIAGWVFRALPLRDRREDIVPLARHFLEANYSGEAPELDEAICEYLVNRHYEGNIRELRQLMERIALRHVGSGPCTVGDLPEDDRPADGALPRAWPDQKLESSIAEAIALGASLREISTVASQTAIRIAVQTEGGNLQRAAKRLGVTDRALQMRRAAGMLGD